jgi:hypothetical protein
MRLQVFSFIKWLSVLGLLLLFYFLYILFLRNQNSEEIQQNEVLLQRNEELKRVNDSLFLNFSAQNPDPITSLHFDVATIDKMQSSLEYLKKRMVEVLCKDLLADPDLLISSCHVSSDEVSTWILGSPRDEIPMQTALDLKKGLRKLRTTLPEIPELHWAKLVLQNEEEFLEYCFDNKTLAAAIVQINALVFDLETLKYKTLKAYLDEEYPDEIRS